jgi:hypothetical protein
VKRILRYLKSSTRIGLKIIKSKSLLISGSQMQLGQIPLMITDQLEVMLYTLVKI